MPPFSWEQSGACASLLNGIVACGATGYNVYMIDPTDRYAHIGEFLKAEVIPKDLTVTATAELLGVGRPALSNLLNGNAALSKEMAARFEKSFNQSASFLLDLQDQFDRPKRQASEKMLGTRAYVPAFLSIKASQIEEWANRLEVRSQLSVLLRHLVRSTVAGVTHLDFPGFDNAERKGWDGAVDSNESTAWVPEGASRWEFGTNKDPSSKAEKDYNARVRSIPAADRSNIHFIFVTPRNWPGKIKWVDEKTVLGEWKSVRVLDASDLEQWLEESVPAQIWLAEKIGLPTTGFRTLEACWRNWIEASEPMMTSAIFRPSVEAHSKKFKEWLDGQADNVCVVSADSVDEALAFLHCLFSVPETEKYFDVVSVFDDVEALRRIASATSSFIPVVTTDDAERELASLFRTQRCIAVRPRNAVVSEAPISVDLLTVEDFEKALEDMGLSEDEAKRLTEESGRSPTILRRRLSPIEAIKLPEWAKNPEFAEWLVPMALIGAWKARSSADKEVLAVIANQSFADVERNLTRLLDVNDSPVWSVGQYSGVVSKLDVLFAVRRFVTDKHLSDFFFLAELVLSEIDPALDLPKEKRWAAGMYGKVRDHSGVLRNRICETLVILSVHGNLLFRERVGFDVSARVASLIRKLLTPLTIEKLLSQDRSLPDYAEAAPDEFLKIFETDLKSPDPVVLGLLKPADSGIFSGCPRTGLLWGLENIAWNPGLLGRVVSLLGKLSLTKIEDNWSNKPIASLESIFRSWMPQTAATLEQRILALEFLTKTYPSVGWHICVEQFSPYSNVGHYSHKPKWRSDAAGAGRPINNRDRFDFIRRCVDIAVSWPSHDENTLGDLVERIGVLSPEHCDAVWAAIEAWAASDIDEKQKAVLRERIRKYAFTRRGRRHRPGEVAEKARRAYDLLVPKDPVVRHGWLFSDHWVDESLDDREDDDFSYEKHQRRIDHLRSEALAEIWEAEKCDGVVRLALTAGAPLIVANFAAPHMRNISDVEHIVRKILTSDTETERMGSLFLSGFLASCRADLRSLMISRIAKETDEDVVVRVLRLSPFGPEVWKVVDGLSENLRARYWKTVQPGWDRRHDSDLNELVDRLIEAKRPRTAFAVVRMDWKKIETNRLKRLMQAIGVEGLDLDSTDEYKLRSYDISVALKSLSGRLEISRQEMAALEFKFIDALDDGEHGIPNLEEEISNSPLMYVQALALAYKRDDDGEDPPEWGVKDPERRSSAGTLAYRLLTKLKRLPGDNGNGKIDGKYLLRWVTGVRELCAKYARADIGDQYIGQYLAKAPVGEDGTWPCREVCEVLEIVAAEHVGIGFHTGVYNSRGAQFRGRGGDQERELVRKYDGYADRVAFEFPYASRILRSLADTYRREAEWFDREDRERHRLR